MARVSGRDAPDQVFAVRAGPDRTSPVRFSISTGPDLAPSVRAGPGPGYIRSIKSKLQITELYFVLFVCVFFSFFAFQSRSDTRLNVFAPF